MGQREYILYIHNNMCVFPKDLRTLVTWNPVASLLGGSKNRRRIIVKASSPVLLEVLGEAGCSLLLWCCSLSWLYSPWQMQQGDATISFRVASGGFQAPVIGSQCSWAVADRGTTEDPAGIRKYRNLALCVGLPRWLIYLLIYSILLSGSLYPFPPLADTWQTCFEIFGLYHTLSSTLSPMDAIYAKLQFSSLRSSPNVVRATLAMYCICNRVEDYTLLRLYYCTYDIQISYHVVRTHVYVRTTPRQVHWFGLPLLPRTNAVRRREV